jgi:hypothetical protein
MGNPETHSYDFHILTNHAAEQRATARRKKLEEAPQVPRESKIAAGIGGLVIVVVGSVALFNRAPAPVATVIPAVKKAPEPPKQQELDLEAPEAAPAETAETR